MSDSLREALVNLITAANQMPRQTPAPGGAATLHKFMLSAAAVWALDKALNDARAALSAPQAEAVAWQIHWPDGDISLTKISPNVVRASGCKYEPLYTAPPSQSAMRKALEALDKVEAQMTAMRSLKGWRMNLMRDYLKETREALSRADEGKEPTIGGTAFCGHGVMASICDKCADEGKESEGGLKQQARNPVGLPDSSGDLASDGGIAGVDVTDHRRQVGSDAPSDPTPPDREAIARIVDPGAFWQLDNTENGGRIYHSDLEKAREKADAIIALQRGGQ